MERLYYYRQNGEIFEKWAISLDEPGLAHLRDEVLDKCSDIIHEEKEYNKSPEVKFRKGCIRNVRLVNDSGDFYKLYSYDVYKPKILVSIIDALLNGGASAITELDNPRPTEAKTDFEQLISEKLGEIDDIPSTERDKKIAAMRELIALADTAKLNENQVSALDYYPKVQALITRELVATMKVKDILGTTEFFGKGVDIFDLTAHFEEEGTVKLSLKPKV